MFTQKYLSWVLKDKRGEGRRIRAGREEEDVQDGKKVVVPYPQLSRNQGFFGGRR